MTDIEKQSASGVEAGKGRPAKRRWLRWLVLVSCVLLSIVVLFVVFAPSLLSTASGRRFVLGQANKQVAGTVEVDKLSLGWLSGQSLEGVVVRDEAGAVIARIGVIDLPDASLWSLVRGKLNLGELRIDQVAGDIVGYEDGTTNLQRALASTVGNNQSTPTATTPSAGPARWPKGLALSVVVRDVDVMYRAEGTDTPIRLMVPEARVGAVDPAHLLLKLDAELSRAQQAGTVRAEATIDQLFDNSGVFQPAGATAHIGGELGHLPIELIDALSKQDGKLLALLGPVLDGQVKADVTTTGGSAWIKADSENLHVNGKLAFDDNGLRRDGDTSVVLTVTPKAWAAQTAVDGKATSTLAEPVEVRIELHGLALPFSDRGLDLANARVDMGYSLGDTRMQIDGVGDVTLANTTGSIQADQLGKKLNARFTSVSGLNRKPGGVNVTVELADLIDADQQINTAGMTAKVNGRLTNAPIAAILDELMPGVTKGLATRTLGPAMDATMNLSTAPLPDGKGVAGAFDIDVLTDGGEAALNTTLIGGFSYGKQAVHAELADGSYVKFTLAPELIEAYQAAFASGEEAEAVDPKKRVSLGAPARFRLGLTEAAADLRSTEAGGYTLDPDKLQLTGKLTSPDLRLKQGGQQAATLKGLLVDITNTGLRGDTRLALKADIDYPTPAGEEPKPGAIDSDTTVSGLAFVDGALSFADATYKTKTQIRQAPIDLVDAMFGMDGELIASVGPRALLEADGSYTPSAEGAAGGLDMLLKSRFSSADLKLLVENDRWKLKSDAPMSFRVNNTLSQVVLKKVNPFLGGAVSAKLPIGVTVKQKGFSAPLHELALKDINAEVLLELGVLDLRGEGQFKEVLQKLGVDSQSLLNVSFSPVTINLDGGRLSYSELVMTIEDIRLGFSGQVDLNTRALDLKMSIPGSSLSRIKLLDGRIKPSDVIVIPLTGTFDQPKLDVKLLTGEIAKAALRGELGGVADEAIRDKIGGEAGAVVGGLLNDLLKGEKPPDQASAPETTEDQQAEPAEPDQARDSSDATEAQPELTPEEREARRERRRLRRERLEREAAEGEAQGQQNRE